MIAELLRLWLYGAIASACWDWIAVQSWDADVRRRLSRAHERFGLSPFPPQHFLSLDLLEVIGGVAFALFWPVYVTWKMITPFWTYPHG